jgi:hypothetical protein
VIAPLSPSNVATVAFAAICLWTIAAQARGNIVKLWRLAVIDFASAASQDPIIEPQHVAAAAAFCAGYLGCRATAVAVRAAHLPHVELHGA